MSTSTVLVTGGAGFIGSEVVRQLLLRPNIRVINIDCLTYAGNLANLRSIEKNPNYRFSQTDICDKDGIQKLFAEYKPQAIVHLAAESHVDRSIDGPADFLKTNIFGTYNLLECTRSYLAAADDATKKNFRFVAVSTDEVFGSLGPTGKFSETTPYDPSSPYSATKAASDHLARAWHRTFGLPVLITNCSNNYGPYQFPEKLIPLTIQKMLKEENIPIYGDGSNVRDWLHVADHSRGILNVLDNGRIGQTYNIGGHGERTNLQVAHAMCDIMDKIKPRKNGARYRDLIAFVKDRPGHDHRYAIDCTKIESELGWKPQMNFEQGLQHTIEWYLENSAWVSEVQQKGYVGQRLGTKTSEQK